VLSSKRPYEGLGQCFSGILYQFRSAPNHDGQSVSPLRTGHRRISARWDQTSPGNKATCYKAQLVHTRLPKPCHHNVRAGPVVYVPCDCARTRQHEHRLVHALGEVHAYIFVKRFVQSAPHQNKLNLLLAFREHDNVLSLFLCCITDITTHRQFVINDQKHIFENTSC
jgi:hypothetical protein